MNNDYFKEHYFFEINRKHQITSSLVIPIGILTVLVSIIGYYFQKFKFESGIITVIFIIMMVPTIYYLFITVYFLFRSYYNQTYRYVPTPLKMKEYYVVLEKYYKEYNIDRDVNSDIQEIINNHYAEATDDNAYRNDSKSAYMHKANTSLIFALIFTMVCFVPYFINHFKNHDKAQKIEIINYKP